MLGIVGGSFAYRLADWLLEAPAVGGMTALPRCPRCESTQTPLHRIALLGLACPSCGIKPSRQQLFVEIGTAALLVGLRYRIESDARAAVYAFATIVLVTVTITDIRARLIPNAVTYPASIIVMIAWTLVGIPEAQASLIGAAITGGFALVVWGLGRLVYLRGDVFGLGDVKLAFFIGAALGSTLALSAFVIGIMVGGLLAAFLLFTGYRRNAMMAYGPALAIGAYITVLVG